MGAGEATMMPFILAAIPALLLAALAFILFTQLGRARVTLARAESERDGAKAEQAALRRERDEAQGSLRAAELALAGKTQALAEREQQMQQWETKFLESAKAAMADTSHKLTSKLLEDHKREAEAAKKLQEEAAKNLNEQVMTRFEEVVKTVHVFSSQAKGAREGIDLVLRTLSNPAAGGQMAEIGLENMLKGLGLEAPRDFVMQYSIPGTDDHTALRADALLFLPRGALMVIDCKSSPALLEWAREEGSEREAEAWGRLKQSMQKHVKDLTDKAYATAVRAAFRKLRPGEEPSRVHYVMYVPSDRVLEKLRCEEPVFFDKARQAGLIPVGLSGLPGLLHLMQHEIGMARQEENQARIVATLTELMDSLVTALGKVGALERGIKAAANGLNDFAGSFNSRVLPKMRALTALGVPVSKPLPAPLDRYSLERSGKLVDGDSELIEDDGRKVVQIGMKGGE